jgi:hypothetical protein
MFLFEDDDDTPPVPAIAAWADDGCPHDVKLWQLDNRQTLVAIDGHVAVVRPWDWTGEIDPPEVAGDSVRAGCASWSERITHRATLRLSALALWAARRPTPNADYQATVDGPFDRRKVRLAVAALSTIVRGDAEVSAAIGRCVGGHCLILQVAEVVAYTMGVLRSVPVGDDPLPGEWVPAAAHVAEAERVFDPAGPS